MTTGKIIALTIRTFVDKVMSLLFNMLFRLVIAFLPRSKHLLISWFQSQCTVIFWAQENRICHCFHFLPTYLPWSDGADAMIFIFKMLSFKPTFSLSSFTLTKRLYFLFTLVASLSAFRVLSPAYLRLLMFLLAVLIPGCESFSMPGVLCI